MVIKLKYISIFICFSLIQMLINQAFGFIPTPDKVVVVVLENHAYHQIYGSPAAPYLNSLINGNRTALFTNSYGVFHPSQPNMLRLYSGSNQGTTNGNLPLNAPFNTPNLGALLINASKTFIGYSEGLPYPGYLGEFFGGYARKHSPWVNWHGSTTYAIPDSLSQPFTSFPSDYSLLPDVSFVIPTQDNDMHNGSDPARITRGDNWILNNLGGYIEWAKTNNSLLILTFDEDDNFSGNHIFTLIVGEPVLPGNYSSRIDHYNVLRTIEDMFSLPYAGASASATPIDYCWDDCSNSAKINPSGPIYFCNGDSAVLTASSGLSYAWSNGATTPSITVSSTGNYRVTVSNGSGCTSTSSYVEVIESDFTSAGTYFKETMDTVLSNTSIATYELNNGFDNDNFTMSGTADVRATVQSAGYVGASGGANVFFTNTAGRNFIISNINTSAYNDLQLSFGIYKAGINSTGSDFIVQVSSDGINYTALNFDPLPAGSGTAHWYLRTATGLIPAVANLSIQFIQTGTATQYRLDDVALRFSTGASYSITVTPDGPTTFCQGDSVGLNATSINTYLWSTGQTTQNIKVGSSGDYFVLGTLISGCQIASNSISVNVLQKKSPAVSISSNLGSSICAGDNAIFSAIPSNGGLSPSYQWKKNGNNVGSNSNSYSNNSLSNNDVLTCVMTTSETCVLATKDTSNSITMTLNQNGAASVSVTNDFADTLCAGDIVTFYAVPQFGGSSPSYQWKKNGTNVGTNSDTYTAGSLNNGDIVKCLMTTSATCATPITSTSNSMTMIVFPNVAPQVTINSDPNDTICLGSNVNFSAIPVNGGPAPIYQWKKNGIFVGTNSSNYSNSSLITNDLIECLMTSSAGCSLPESVSSNGISMTVNNNVVPSISISSNIGTIICSGANVVFTAIAVNGGNAPIYQWKKNGLNVGNNSNIVSINTLSNTDEITCTLTSNTICPSPASVISNSLIITVNSYVTPSIIISANTGNTFCEGVNVTFTATPVNGGNSPSYQWKKNGVNVGINSNTYSDNALTENDIILCMMTSNASCINGNPATSNTKNITITRVPTIQNFSPATASSGVGVTINGTNFTGITSVKFNGINSSFVVNNSTKITAYVPTGATTGNITVTNNCGIAVSGTPITINSTAVILNLKIFIEGYYKGSGLMTEVVSPGICDTVTVDLCENVFPFNVLYTSRSIVNASGDGAFNFPLSADGSSFYITVNNHNTLKTWSSNSLLFSMNTNYDFTNAASKAFGNNQKNLGDGRFALFSGDVNQDSQINITDFEDLKNAIQLFPFGYLIKDLTGDYLIESADFSLLENNIGRIIMRP